MSTRTSIPVSSDLLALFNKKKLLAEIHIKQSITAEQFLKYMLDAEKWTRKK